mgnify:CR=1 FL=1
MLLGLFNRINEQMVAISDELLRLCVDLKAFTKKRFDIYWIYRTKLHVRQTDKIPFNAARFVQ